jgi:hypothetical protein
MVEIPWYSEAALVARGGHVYCAGTLAQCIRKWGRLPELDQASCYIKLVKEIDGRMKLGREDVAVLASRSEFPKV